MQRGRLIKHEAASAEVIGMSQITPYRMVPVVVVLILLVPAVAMQFTAEVSWQWGDFVLMGAMLLAVGWGAVWFLQHLQSPHRWILVALLLLLFLLLWIELAVGLL